MKIILRVTMTNRKKRNTKNNVKAAKEMWADPTYRAKQKKNPWRKFVV